MFFFCNSKNKKILLDTEILAVAFFKTNKVARLSTTVPDPYFRQFYADWETFDQLHDSALSTAGAQSIISSSEILATMTPK